MAEEEGGGCSSAAPPPQQRVAPPPMITLPPRSSFETLLAGGPGFSPGPMTLVSNFFSDQFPDSDCRSFSQLLAGAMASPAAQIPASTPPENDSCNKEEDPNKNSGGFKQNRPMNLVIAQSPSGFMFPSGFSPTGLLNSPGFFSPLESPFGMSHQQALAHVTAQAALSQSFFNNSIQPEFQSSSLAVSQSQEESQMPIETSDLEDSQMGSPEDVSVSQSDVGKPQRIFTVSADSKPASDGYNWRKYGQKSVKASEHPRSYYKCTHIDCPVKKKVGRSLDGQISDIVYKGQHNHEPPRPNKRTKEGADAHKPKSSQSETYLSEEPAAGYDQVSDQLMQNVDVVDEPNPKRRNIEVGSMDFTSLSHKTVTEPKIVVQTRSEVDLLDDGFKWRKYGQKVVKGNTNPRSYYKCTYPGCNVRKHVERASSDPKSVVTTYEGKHNHDIPVSRHRSYSITNGGGQQQQQGKPEKGTAGKPLRRKETKFEKDQRPVLLQLKEEQITA